MSQENVEIVRAAQQQFARGDFSGIDAGTYRGEAARRWLTAWHSSFEGLTIESTEMIDAGDEVFAGLLQRGHPHGSRAVVAERSWQW